VAPYFAFLELLSRLLLLLFGIMCINFLRVIGKLLKEGGYRKKNGPRRKEKIGGKTGGGRKEGNKNKS
jgi:hypothetical protein